MKILIVTPYFVPAYAYGGPVAVVLNTAKELVERGNDVTVLTTNVLDAKNKYTGPKQTKVEGIEVKYFNIMNNKLAYYFNIYRCFGFEKHLKTNLKKYEIVHIHDYFTHITRITANECIKQNKPYVITTHGVLNPERVKHLKIVKDTFIKLNNNILGKAKFVLALTQDEKKVLKKYIPTKNIRIIPNGIFLDEFKKKENPAKFIEKYGLENNKIILYVGRIQKIKGLDILVKAFSKANLIKTKLVIVGPNEGYLDTLKKVVKEESLEKDVVFPGILKGKELSEAYASADLFGFTSYSEGLPMTILESAAMGIPLIISKYCNVPEVKEYNAGYVLENDTKKISEKMRELIENKKLRETKGKNAKIMVKEKFMWESVVDKLEEAYGD